MKTVLFHNDRADLLDRQIRAVRHFVGPDVEVVATGEGNQVVRALCRIRGVPCHGPDTKFTRQDRRNIHSEAMAWAIENVEARPILFLESDAFPVVPIDVEIFEGNEVALSCYSTLRSSQVVAIRSGSFDFSRGWHKETAGDVTRLPITRNPAAFPGNYPNHLLCEFIEPGIVHLDKGALQHPSRPEDRPIVSAKLAYIDSVLRDLVPREAQESRIRVGSILAQALKMIKIKPRRGCGCVRRRRMLDRWGPLGTIKRWRYVLEMLRG